MNFDSPNPLVQTLLENMFETCAVTLRNHSERMPPDELVLTTPTVSFYKIPRPPFDM